MHGRAGLLNRTQIHNVEENGMKYSDIIKNIDDIFDYFKFHSKNLTKTQEYKLDDLRNLIHELRIAMEE